ncbi:MAG: hypothetical protein IPJ79_15395 [Bacteroidetes bacterium]|nr:hypothetical protein [Bacteroidota bacterium]
MISANAQWTTLNPNTTEDMQEEFFLLLIPVILLEKQRYLLKQKEVSNAQKNAPTIICGAFRIWF